MNIQKAISDSDIIKCTEVMSSLRPQLNSENIAVIISGMISRGYHLIFIEEHEKAVSTAGYRFTEHLHWGKVIYIDDLCTLPSHQKKVWHDSYLITLLQKPRKTTADKFI
jgi:hypothetical protein